MTTAAISLIQGTGPSSGLDLTSILIIVLVLGGVGLVFWASRPSVISRYAARPPSDDDEEDGRPPADPSSTREIRRK